MSQSPFGPGVEITGRVTPEYAEILTPEAVGLPPRCSARSAAAAELLARRDARQAAFDAGKLPDFLPETRAVRDADWTCAPIPADLQDRRVEITGPVDRKMIINALNSGANVFMADFEDANSPTWDNHIEGQINLRDAIRRHDRLRVAREARTTRSTDKLATLLVRPRGWHLAEKHVLVDGQPISGGIFDFGLYFFHNAKELVANGSGPYFYLPKMESHLEARLWNDVFVMAQDDARRAARHDQGDGADRDDPGRVRDGRDPLRAARALGRAELRPLGLHLQLHQEVRAATATSAWPTARWSR